MFLIGSELQKVKVTKFYFYILLYYSVARLLSLFRTFAATKFYF